MVFAELVCYIGIVESIFQSIFCLFVFVYSPSFAYYFPLSLFFKSKITFYIKYFLLRSFDPFLLMSFSDYYSHYLVPLLKTGSTEQFRNMNLSLHCHRIEQKYQLYKNFFYLLGTNHRNRRFKFCIKNIVWRRIKMTSPNMVWIVTMWHWYHDGSSNGVIIIIFVVGTDNYVWYDTVWDRLTLFEYVSNTNDVAQITIGEWPIPMMRD